MVARILIVLVLLVGNSVAQVGNLFSGSTANQITFTAVKIGGAGAITGVASNTAGTLMLARADQYGCYIATKSGSWSAWTQIETSTAMPALSVTASDGAPIGTGCDEAIPDPTNANNLWVGFSGNIYVSTNQGASFGATCYPTQSTPQAQNQVIKGLGRTIAVDPNNSNVVYMSTPSNGLRFSNDLGVSCSTVSGVGTATTISGIGGGHLIAFDISAGTTTVGGQTRTKNVYASTYGTGVYKSTDGGVTWTLTTSTPTTHWYMTVDAAGVVWFIDNSVGQGGTARTYNGTWSAISSLSGKYTTAAAYDPSNCASAGACHVVYMVGGGNGGTAYTVNGGSSWNLATGNNTFVATDTPWIFNEATAIGFFPAGVAFDNGGRAYIGAEGVFYVTPPTVGTALTITSQTAGIEEFETNVVVNGTGGALVLGGWDIGCFTLAAPFNTYPGNAQHGCVSPNQPNLQHASFIDWVAGTPGTMVVLADNQQGYGGGTYASYSGVSTDGGATWSAFAAVPANVTSGGNKGGCIAAASTTNFMWAPTDGTNGAVFPSYTTNGGTSWTAITVSGVTQGWPFQFYLNSRQCAADRVAANTFYLYNWNVGSGLDAIIKCTSSGASCAIQSNPTLGANRQFNPTLKSVPGQSGHIFLAYGTTFPPGDTTGNGFYYYTDGGITKNTIANAQGVSAFGFGVAAPGHSYPTIYFAGWYNHVYGIWQSIDWDGAKTWQKVGTYPRNIPLPILDIDGDKASPGVVYLGTVSGVFCGSPNTSLCN